MSRPRGFTDWRPQRRTRVRLEAVLEILNHYRDHLPLTLRQIFYRLVGTDQLNKAETEYANLCELINRARRARIIPMNAIRDDGFIGGMGIRTGYLDVEEFMQDVRGMAGSYTRDRQDRQERRLVLFCEAGGMVPQPERVATPYGVPVKSSGGFDSTTVKHAIAEAWRHGPVTVLHVGDLDPSGECMFDALSEDVRAFSEAFGGDVEFIRLAVTHKHIALYDLPTAPPKQSSHQINKRMQVTTQAEALDPADLANIARDGIVNRMDMVRYQQAVETEHDEREALMSVISCMGKSD
jgi:hypothetical protein